MPVTPRSSNKLSLRCQIALLAVTALLPVSSMATPGDILFSDNFEDGNLGPWSTTNASISGVRNSPGFAGTGSFGAYTSNAAVTVTSPSINAAVPEARLDIWVRRGSDLFSEDTDPGEDFVFEYQRADSSWVALRTYLGSGTKGQIFNDTYILPQDALHGSLALRLRQTGGSGFDFDYWHFDDVVVTEIAPALPLRVGRCDDFESGLSTNWNINQTTGFAGINSATSQSPRNSMYLNGGVVEVLSNTVDTSLAAFGDLTVWIRRGADAFSEDPDGGENLVVEYFDDTNNWVALETFSGSGGPGQTFSRAYNLPAAGRHAGFRLRFRMTGGSGAPWDYWHVDDVCFDISTDPVLQVSKVVQVVSDPINGTTNPRAIPGATMTYVIGVTNQGGGIVDTNTMVITDVVPTNTELYVDTSSGDPISFIDGATPSGLNFSFATDVTFSNQPAGGPPYSYSPVPDAQGFDPLVTGFRVNPSGQMDGATGGNNPSFDIGFDVRVR